MYERELKVKIFEGSTIDLIEKQLELFLLEQGMNPSSYIDLKLLKLDNEYVCVVIFTELVQQFPTQ